ncbi:Hypothetical predicted protein [Cloeon dipterum]|uniref:Uncharacterized protein n=1 Tax=Cloeon dipterum TaxID=197152 RepID=A0A8S1DNA9_9INSE|nr:Hypothetical predicted protein [Cloeon dipterum]
MERVDDCRLQVAPAAPEFGSDQLQPAPPGGSEAAPHRSLLRSVAEVSGASAGYPSVQPACQPSTQPHTRSSQPWDPFAGLTPKAGAERCVPQQH